MMTFGRALTTTTFRSMAALVVACALLEPAAVGAQAAAPTRPGADLGALPAPECEEALRAEVAQRGWSLDWQRLAELSAPSVVDYTEARRRAAGATIALVVTPTRAHVDARFLSHREERRIARDAAETQQPGCAMLRATLSAHDAQNQRRQRYLWVAGVAALISAAAAAGARSITRRHARSAPS